MNLKDFRESYNLTQTELAKRIGVPRTTYQSWESGERKPKPSNQLKINMLIRRYENHKLACKHYEALTRHENKPHFLPKRKLLKLFFFVLLVIILTVLW